MPCLADKVTYLTQFKYREKSLVYLLIPVLKIFMYQIALDLQGYYLYLYQVLESFELSLLFYLVSLRKRKIFNTSECDSIVAIGVLPFQILSLFYC